ncbi:MAG: YraN family protein [Clostridia bacterium]|nr:YraN family protein [Clostridia bacterium]
MNLHEIGMAGEDLAAEYLIAKGYRILERNMRIGHLEIDILACDRDTLAVVEVKTRLSSLFGRAEEQISKRKRQALIRCAQSIWASCPGWNVRVDVVAIAGRMTDEPSLDAVQIEHFIGVELA